ncbi:hypothetical protein SUGI_0908410 [Cryptomeria japonica]|uniref:uncharacterized protein LOC131040939 n=1 Tax=Cryptomeria japonica TaxID=3369 RepID=UPI0024148D83|nr:uncharacterized protein LOC131040939 [Cryptomeria japonica]XP_059066872.1 uncharacterized protein LOC131040939 [Cryptomeria japonica]GLJ43635.1 hypothetical protein SUGI_0908410 [Cryptomeria japonica]
MANYRATGAAPSSSRSNGQQLGGLNSPIRDGKEENTVMSYSQPAIGSSNSEAASSCNGSNTEQLWRMKRVSIGKEDCNSISLSPPGNGSSSSTTYYSAEESFQEQSIKGIHKIQAKLQVFEADTLHSIKNLTTDIQAYLSEMRKEIHSLQNTMTNLSLGTEETEPVETYILQFNFRRRNPIENKEDSIEAVKEHILKRILGFEDSQLPKIKNVLQSDFTEVLVVFADSFSKEIVLQRANERRQTMAGAEITIFNWTR